MADLGESVAPTIIKLDSDPEYQYSELQICYPNGSPYFVEDELQIIMSIDGDDRAAQTNLECSVNQTLLEPGTKVEFKIEENIDAEIAETRQKIKAALDLIIEKEREEQKMYDDQLAEENWLNRKLILTGAFMVGVGEGAVGLVEFVGDTAELALKASWYQSQVTVANNLEAAWETAYKNGNLKDFFNSVGQKNVEDFATAFGITPEELATQIAEAYEIFAFIMADAETKPILLQFAKDYAAAQAKVEWAKMGGSAVFDIILTAILAVTTGGVGNAAQAGAKVRHFAYFKKLAEHLKVLVRQLRRKAAKKSVKGKPNSTVQHKVEMPPKQKLEPQKSKAQETKKTEDQTAGDASKQDAQNGNSSDSNTTTNKKDGTTEDTSQQGKNKQDQSCQKDSLTCKDGEPISLVTGEEILTLVDFEFNGVLALPWLRTYKSSNPDNVGLGFGWTHSFSESLKINNTGLEWHTNEARIVPLNLPRVGASSQNLAEKIVLVRSAENQFRLRSSEPGAQLEKIFERSPGQSQFNLVQICDTYQNALSLDYRQGQLTQIQASHGDVWRLEYNHQNCLAKVVKVQSDGNLKCLVQYHYDQYNDLIRATDPNGNAEQYRYHHHLIQQRTLKSGYSFHFKWDDSDHSARCLEQYGDHIEGVPTYHYRFAWDKTQRKVAVTDTRGGVKIYQFNERGLPIYYRDPEGGETVNRYDDLGNLLAIKTPNGHYQNFHYDQQQRPIIFANALGHKTELVRNRDGLVSHIYDPLGQRWSRKYDDQGALAQSINPLGEAITFTRNKMGLIQSVSNSEGQSWHYIWDHKGQLTAIRDPLNRHTRYSYDDENQLTKVTYPNNQTTEYSYDAAGNCVAITGPDGKTQHYEFNNLGLVTKTIDATGKVTEYAYNGLSQVVRRVDSSGHVLRYHYDGERNLIGLTNQNGEHYRLAYDLNERLVEEVGFDGRIQEYHYDAEGFLIGKADISRDRQKSLNEIVFKRDATGKLLQQAQLTEHGLTPLNHFQYDALGRILEARNSDRTLKWRFDPVGRLLEEQQDQHAIQHQYNKAGQRISSTLPDGKQLNYKFDPTGLFSALHYDGQCITQVERDESGRELNRHHSNALTTEYRYDPQGRLMAQRTGKRQANKRFEAVSQRRLSYNEQGLLQQIDDQLRGRTRYHYDEQERLIKVDGPNPERFIHDPAGNLLATQTPEEQPQPGDVKGNRLNFYGDSHFQYDDLGNRVTVRRGKNQAQTSHYHYDALNQLSSLDANGHTTRYAYDPLGRRISKVDSTKRVDFLWMGDQLLNEIQREQEQITAHKTYLFEPGTFKPLALVQNKKVYHYHLDHLGTPQEITDAEGNLVWAVRYRAYGNLAVAFKNEIENNLRFQGQYYDSESGLHYNRFRYYDPDCGRFINQDPIGLLGGLNGYLYVPNPTGWVDPFGLSSSEISSICPRKTDNLAGGPLENASQTSGRFQLEGGDPNSVLYRADNQNNVTSYIQYDEHGMAIKRVDVTGADHGGVPTPHVLEYGRNTLPDGTVRVNTPKGSPVRPARPEEIP